MDVAALSLQIDSSDVVKAANDLDQFASASDRAKTAASGQSGSIARMSRDYSRAAEKAAQYSNAASRAAEAAQRSAAASAAGSSSLLRLGDGYDVLTGKLNSNLVAINRNIAGWEMQGRAVNDNAAAMRANTGNIAAQFQDIGVTAAMGMNPMLIALQQGTQLSAVFAQTGGSAMATMRAALGSVVSPASLLTIGLVALVAVVIQLGMAWFNSKGAADKLAETIDKLKFAADGVSDAQSILGKVFDLTTGKMKTQTAAAINLARAQLLLMQVTAQANISKAAKDLEGASSLGAFGRVKAYFSDRSLIEGSARVDALTKALKANQITGAQALKGFEMLRDRGLITQEMFAKGTVAAANYGAEVANVATATQALADLEKGKLSDIFMDTDRKSGRKSGKSEAQKQAEALLDIFAGAKADIAAEQARALAEANQLGAFEAARLEKQTALLNAIQQRGIPITDAARKRVAELADEYARIRTAANVSVAINGVTDDIQRQRDAVADQTKLVGLYGDALARARRELEAQRKLRESLPRDEVVVIPNLTEGLSDDIEKNARADRIANLRKDAEDFAYAMDLERGALGLTGAAALEYAFVAERLNEAKRKGIAQSPEEIAAIRAAAEAYAAQRYAIDQQIKALSDAREVTKGFFSDWINGVREGGNIFSTFADSVVNSLNRIIDKLLDRTLDGFLDSLFSGGGLLGGLFGGGSSRALVDDGSMKAELDKIFSNLPIRLPGFALGGTFDRAQRFANGGAFTNTIVNTPTLFRFANGAALGEMGEAGPEAIMPLTRGPDGKLGVQSHGGGSRNAEVNVTNHYQFAGAVGLDAIIAMIRQGGEATYNQVKRDLETMLQQSDADGAVAT